MNRTSWKVLSFEGFSNKGLKVLAYPPKLLGKHCLVHEVEFFKTNATLFSILAHFIPMDQV